MVDTDDTRQTTTDRRRTTPQVWHKLPTGELKAKNLSNEFKAVNSGTNNFAVTESILD